MKRFLHQRWSNIMVNVALAALVVIPVYAASTIGTNISTGGTLSVTGASTLTGVVTATGGVTSGANITVPAAYALDVAATGVLNLGTTTATTINIGRSGQTQALLGNATVAGTLTVTGVSALTGNVGIGTTTPGTALGVTGAGVFTGPLTFTWLDATSTTATSTLSTGGLTIGTNQFVVQQNSGNVGVATTSPWGVLAVEQGTETNSFIVSNNGSSSPSFVITGVSGNGKIGAGTTSPYASFSIQSGSGTTGTDAFVVATSTQAAVFGIDNDGHRFSSGPAPALSSCGTTPSIVGSDSGGTVTAGTGSPTACTLTFAKAYRNTPYCNVNTGANTASSSVTSISTTAVTFSIVPTVNSIALHYSCAYHQ
jgi:hypothetical protein